MGPIKWPIRRVQVNQDSDLPNFLWKVLDGYFSPKGTLTHHLRDFEGGHLMSSKLTELTESFPSAPPPSVLHGSGILSQFSSLSMASSVHFDPTQTYDGYKAAEVLDPACTECLENRKDCFEHYNPRSSKCHYCFIGKKPCCRTGKQASNVRRFLWSKKDRPFGKDFPVTEAPTLEGTSGYSYLTGSRQRDLARWTNVGGPIPVGSSDELDGEEVEVVPNSTGHPSNTSNSQPPSKRFQSHIIPSTPRNFQPTLATIPPASPNSSHTRPALHPAVRPSPIQQPQNSPIVTSQQLQPVASTSRRREEISHFPFPAAQVFQHRDHWPIGVTREDPNTASENKDSVARLFRRVDRNSREVIMYANDRTIPGTDSEEMASNFSWYEDELINYFQKTFDHLDRDN
ncbi:hypothetical protein O181_021657 [Austropuccinia psidii MF-1]|uniref:Uncharacterized protein n=1 Tax=Austropuccinia psidii MF-1 TaxID=1389203 RepID=A0A9Q3CE17_9BASI|nr:hypothetical protein [Austropuccinia psidii MF-1]